MEVLTNDETCVPTRYMYVLTQLKFYCTNVGTLGLETGTIILIVTASVVFLCAVSAGASMFYKGKKNDGKARQVLAAPYTLLVCAQEILIK